MSILELPRSVRMPRLTAITDRTILDKAQRFERALSAWQAKARILERAMYVLQAASDDLYRVANIDGPDGRSLEPSEAEQRTLLCDAISALDRHLARFD